MLKSNVLQSKWFAILKSEGIFMPETTLQAPSPSPLTSFTEDEILFRDNVRQFADEKSARW